MEISIHTHCGLGYKLLTVLALFLMISCQENEPELRNVEQEYPEPKIRMLTFDQAAEHFTLIKERLGLSRYISADTGPSGAFDRGGDTTGFTISTSVVKEATIDGYTSYTMLLEPRQQDSTKIYNLTIEENRGNISVFTVTYTPTESWLRDRGQNYEGDIAVQRHLLTREDDMEIILEGDDGGSSSGGGGTGGYTPYYPSDCEGTVSTIYHQVPYSCTCAPRHMPGDDCDCPRFGGEAPGYETVPLYKCIEGIDWSDPSNPFSGSYYGGGGSGSGGGSGPSSLTVLVSSGESSTTPGSGTTVGGSPLIDLCAPDIANMPGYDTWSENNRHDADLLVQYLVDNNCSPEAQAFAQAAAEAMLSDPDLDFNAMLDIVNGMDKDCQALVVFKALIQNNSDFTNLIKDTFVKPDSPAHINFMDLAVGEGTPPMPANVGARVQPYLGVYQGADAVILEFNNDHLDTASNLGYVNTLYHELLHAYIIYLYHSGELLTVYPSYTSLNPAISNFLQDPLNPEFIEDYQQEMHDVYVDFIDMLANSLYQYCLDNDISGVDLEYAEKLVWGGLNGNDVFYENLSGTEQIEVQTLLGHENTDTNNAVGPKTCN